MNHASSRIGLITAIALSALCAAPQATAADRKGYSTNVCVPNGPAAANDLSYSHQGLFNGSFTENRIVICPLISDTEGFYGPDNAASVTVRYRTASSTPGRINCTIYVGSLGTQSWSAAYESPQHPANTDGIFTININPETALSFRWEPVNLVCSLTPRVRMSKIYMSETGATQE